MNVKAGAPTSSGGNAGTNFNPNVGMNAGPANAGGMGMQQPGQKVDFTNFLQHANHPGIVFFTLIFKVGAIVSFLFLNLFLGNEALTFIIVVILTAFDFWFVKNVSGRILAGLRWWNEVKEDGSEVWIFESDHEGKLVKKIKNNIFENLKIIFDKFIFSHFTKSKYLIFSFS